MSHHRSLFIGLLALTLTLGSLHGLGWAEDAAPAEGEEAELTPLNDFAPDDVRPALGKRYDQAVTINKVSIEGNRLIDDETIRSQMSTRPGSLYSKGNLRTDLRRIYDMGYFTEKIRAVPVSTSKGIHLRIEVEENAPVTGVNIQGNTLVNDSELQEIFAGQTGMPQNIGQLNESIAKIEAVYADKGFILARVKSISDDPDGVINLEVNEGKINSVQFVGNRKTKDNVVERMMLTKKDQVYNEKLLKEDMKRIFSLQSFSDVRRVITVSPDDPDKYDLIVELDEKKTGAISLGGGIDTGTGVFGSVGYTDPNFLGRGQNARAIFGVGTGIIQRNASQARARTYQFELGWSNPSMFNTVNSLDTSLYARDLASLNMPLAIERRIGTEVTWSRPLQWKNTSFSLGLRGERVNLREGASISDLNAFGVNAAQRNLKGGTFVALSPTLAYDTRDDRFDPSSGWLNTISMTGAYGIGNDSYGTVQANVSKYFKIRDGVTLALNAQGGTSLLGDVPEFNMFRMGGSYSVRGFGEGGLGTGGGFLMSSAELRTKVPFLDKLKNVPLVDTVRTAFFLDAGTVIDESASNALFGKDGFGASVGMGLRVNIPGVGPIRIDYAVPITSVTDDRFVRHFNFGVGQKF